MINSVVVVGRVGQDPDMRYFESGKVKTTFSIAVNRWSKNGEFTDWFNIYRSNNWYSNCYIARIYSFYFG